MDEIPVVANAYYLMDKGYVKFDSLYKHFHQNHAWFVTRAKDNILYIVTESREVDTQTGLISDETIYTQIWIAICDYLLLIIAKKQYGLNPSLHTISNSIGQILFRRGDIRDFCNKPDEPANVPEDDSNRQLTLW